MRSEFEFPSQGEGRIHCCRWTPEQPPKAVLQIVHGVAEYALRYEGFAEYLNSLGFLVVAEDHMGHGASMDTGTQGYFAGGWDAAVADSYHLLEMTKEAFPELPYFIFGHSMGSFMTRTLLAQHPDCGLRGAIICGTGWTPKPVLLAGRAMCQAVCAAQGERTPSERVQALVFGGYNKRVEHPRTPFDWLNRDSRQVDAYIADPKCGFIASAGLMRDLLGGLLYVQDPKNLAQMNPDVPVFFVAGGDDPVGNYGKGVSQTAAAFRRAGVKYVQQRIYPLCRHEILNEINRQEIWQDIAQWLLRLCED